MALKINNKVVAVSPGQTLLEAAEAGGFKIPALCRHPDLGIKANCRLCLVEIKGAKRLAAACATLATDGQEVLTDSPRVKTARRLNLELLFGSHTKKCADCISGYDCELLRLAKEYKVDTGRFRGRKIRRKTYRFANAVEVDGSQCIDCQNCVEACGDLQGIKYLEMRGAGIGQEIVPVKDKATACVYCGQCALHCPAASAQEQAAWPAVEAALKDKSRIVMAQFAPAVRVSLGEEFGLPYGENVTGKTYSALRRLGFKYLFDINFGADITTMVEAEELGERLKDKKAFPLTTSCCPAWVAYAEFYHPELLPHLTTARSPHIHSAGAIKTYWAKRQGINPKKIVVVSIVPCTAKKYEASRQELWLKGRPLVDYVLTARELAYLIKKHNIDFKNLPEGRGEPLFNDGSGAAAIYGASGGVMESALRTAGAILAGSGKAGSVKKPFGASPLEFKEVRGLAGFKSATINLGGRKLKVGVVNGLGNFSKLLPHFKKYHYIEVMACPGGCLGGGGQPLPTTRTIREKRRLGLYNIDTQKTMRRAHDNRPMLEYYEWVKKNGLAKKLLYTKFKKSAGSILNPVVKRPAILPAYLPTRR